MTMEIIFFATDWWGFVATLISGAMAAIATMAAVIYTNNRTQKQLKEQKEQFENERRKEFRRSKYVVIKPTLQLSSFYGLLDRLLVQNDYNRVLLFSGDDGFDFYEDVQKLNNQKCRILLIENKSTIDINDITLRTKTVLRNMNTDAMLTYETKNGTISLRGYETIAIRVLSQTQFEEICSMNENSTPNLLNFECRIEYSTLADQRITYIYEIEIHNDHNIEVKKDGVESVVDLLHKVVITPTIFRNLQDSISGVDRGEYYGVKMGRAQGQGFLSQLQSMGQNQISNGQYDTDDTPE